MTLDRDMLMGLAADHGTPLYVYDGDLMLRRYRELHTFIGWPKLRIHYAMKANYCPALLRLLAAEGACLDTVSPGDVLLGRRCGFPVDRMLYTANNMRDDEVRRVHASGVLMNIGSLSRLERYGREFPGSRVCLRFNPDVVAGEHAKVRTGGDLTKFGILLEDADRAREIADRHQLRIVGLHEHTGSGIAETEHVFQSIAHLLSIAKPERFPELAFVDFGGGFRVPYHPDEPRIDYAGFGARLTRTFAEFCDRFGRELWMFFEPGKYIVAESGYLLTTVNTLKDNRGRCIAGTDSGFPQLIRPVFYDAYHQILNLTNPVGPVGPYDICGNICETGDLFAAERPMPAVREGDLLAICNAGAYCYAMGSVYNLRPMPPEVVVSAGRPTLARRGLSDEELVDRILEECC